MYSVQSIASLEGAHVDCGRKLLFQLVASSPAELAMLEFSACTWRTLTCSSSRTSVHRTENKQLHARLPADATLSSFRVVLAMTSVIGKVSAKRTSFQNADAFPWLYRAQAVLQPVYGLQVAVWRLMCHCSPVRFMVVRFDQFDQMILEV